uniref:Probable glycerol kinase n=1 Tax=Angiostrongylus cantonensis TaxID=6313 RepID=A0A0K0DD57_ANGCA
MVLLAAIDQGTSSSRFLVFESDNGDLVASHQIEVRQLFPNPGWVEMDPVEIIDTVKECIRNVVDRLKSLGIAKDEIKSIGIANQRETTVVWDSQTGKPLANAIVWLDSRTSTLAEESIRRTESKSQDEFKEKTGLPIHPYFSALKLKWLIENEGLVKKALADGRLLFGTVDTWLIWKLTGEHLTDVTNASRTLLFDLHKRKWSTEMCEFFDIPQDILPRIMSSATTINSTTSLHLVVSGPLKGVAISGCLGDQQAAMVGHNCLQRGDTKNTYGTGTFMLCNIGPEPTIGKSGLLTTVGFQFGPEAPVVYALEGSGSIGGNVVRFLRDNFQFIKDTNEMEEICRSVDSTEGVVFVPCFTGLYTPHWDPTARGTIIGLTQVTSKAHVCLAALRAIAFQSAEMLEPMSLENALRCVYGTVVLSKLLRILEISFQTSKITEITGWGAAVAAGIGLQQISETTRIIEDHRPRSDDEQRAADMKQWKEAVKRACGWAHWDN